MLFCRLRKTIVTINLKIEIIKVFKLEFCLTSEKKKRDDSVKETNDSESAGGKPTSSGK